MPEMNCSVEIGRSRNSLGVGDGCGVEIRVGMELRVRRSKG